MKIFDSHVHIYPEFLQKNRENIAKREPWFDMLSSSKPHKWGTIDGLIATMDANGIEKSFATTFAFRDQGLCREMNDYLFDAASRFPERIIPLAVVSPTCAGASREVERAFEIGAAGIGELFPDGQSFSLSSKVQLREICGLCEENNKFLLFHTAEQAGHQYVGKGVFGAREAAAFCRNFPLTRVIFAHFGGGLWAFSAMPEMRNLMRRAMFDTAAWPWLYGPEILDAIFAIGAGDKILFGSDWPLLEFTRYSSLLDQTHLIEEQKIDLLSGNAERFLNG